MNTINLLDKIEFSFHQKRLFERLKKDERQIFFEIMKESITMDKYKAHDFINMYFMRNDIRPKNWTIIDELCHSLTRIRD